MPAPGTTPPVCYIRSWTAFEPGLHKGQLYSRADCLAMGANFTRLSTRRTGLEPLIVPRVKIGHDVEERLSNSLGFPALGRIYGMRVAPDGRCAFDLEIPTQVGAMVNADWYRDGSIEISPPLPDPDDPAKKLYPVLVAISLLGEEQPAVPVRFPMPRAVFADGTEVPAATDLTPLAQAMAEVARTFSNRSRPTSGRFSYLGRTYSTAVVCFSALTPLPGNRTMTPEQKAALAAAPFNWTPDQIAAAESAMAADPSKLAAVPPKPADTPPPPVPDPMAAMSAKFAADPSTPPYAKDIMSALSAFAADCTKRFGAMEGAVGDMQKDKPAMQAAAAFASQYQTRIAADHRSSVERDVDLAISQGRLEPRDRADKVTAGLAKNNTTTFSAGTANAGKTEYAVWRDDLLSRTPSPFFRDLVDDSAGTGNALDDRFVKEALAHMGPKGAAILAGAK